MMNASTIATEAAHPQALVMVDTALFTIHDERLCLILARRREAPFAGALALPGGFVHIDEDADTESAARRVIRAAIRTAERARIHVTIRITSAMARLGKDWIMPIAIE